MYAIFFILALRYVPVKSIVAICLPFFEAIVFTIKIEIVATVGELVSLSL